MQNEIEISPVSEITDCSLSRICQMLGITRQAHYQWRKHHEAEVLMDDLIIEEVLYIRTQMLPRVGVRKLYHMLHERCPFLMEGVGRDKLFDILRSAKLLIVPKRKFVVTTDSKHWMKKYRNEIKDLKIETAGMVLVTDITYIRLTTGFCYLALVTDFYSRKILGFDVSTSPTTEACLRALKMALQQIPKGVFKYHHSDRGSQYCANDYVEAVKKATGDKDAPGIMSMTTDGNVYENALAERVNGILKLEFSLDGIFGSARQARHESEKAIHAYNHYRPHLSLQMKTPEMVFRSSIAKADA